MLTGVGNLRSVDVHTGDVLVRVAFGQKGSALATAAGHIQHAQATEVFRRELIALHMDVQACQLIQVLRVEILRVNPFDGVHGFSSV
jgi:hypothetical protein